MNRIVSIFNSGMAVFCLIFIISCNDSTNDEQVFSPFKISTPIELKQFFEIDLQSLELANPLNWEQKKALELITNQLKNKINELMIYYKSFEKENKKGKVIIY